MYARTARPDAAPIPRAGNGRDPGEDTDGADTGSVWDAIPSWQYGGRHAESGGIARREQERALEDIQRRAEAVEAADAADGTDDPVS